MDTQRRELFRKKPLSGARKRPDAFWSLIVPAARLKKRRLDTTTGTYPAHPQNNHAEELEGTQPMVCKETGNPHVITSANAADLYPNHGVTPKDTKPVERRVGGRPEPRTREKPVNLYASMAEDSGRTESQTLMRREKGRPEPTARAQPAHPYNSLAEQLKRTQPVESDKYVDDHGLPKGEALAPTSALHKGDEDRESSKEPNDTEGSDGDEEYTEDDNADDSETASDASSPGTKRSRLSYDTPQRASAREGGCLREASEATIPRRKTVASQPASTKGRIPRKKLKVAVEESDEEDEEEAANESVPQKVTRVTKIRALRQSASILPPLSRKGKPWTKEESETLFRLRSQGESWKYIGERVLGRTATGAESYWTNLRTESLQPVEAQAKRRRQRQRSSTVSVMAKILNQNRPWSKEEEGILASLHAQGKKMTYICRRIRGRGYGACASHWLKIKDQYPQGATAFQDLESNKKGDPSDRPNAQFPSASQLDQEAKEAESNSFSAINECEDPKLSSNDDSLSVPGDDGPAAKHTYQEAVAVQARLLSATAINIPKSKATTTNHRNQQASEHVTLGEDSTPSTNGLAHQDQPNLQSVFARRDTETKKKWSYPEDITAGISAQGTQKSETHRRSHSWPQGRRV